MDERFNDVERDFDLEYLNRLDYDIVEWNTKRERKNPSNKNEAWGVSFDIIRCRIWIFQMNWYYYRALNVNTLYTLFFRLTFWINSFLGRARSFISQKQMVNLFTFNEKIMVKFVLISFTWSHTSRLNKMEGAHCFLFFYVFFFFSGTSFFLWAHHSYVVVDVGLFCPGFTLESVELEYNLSPFWQNNTK